MNQIKKNGFYLFILMQPFLDLITSLMTRFIDLPITLGIAVRGFVFLLLIFYLLFLNRSPYQKVSKYFTLLIGVYAFFYLVTKMDGFHISFLFSECIYLVKFFYLPIWIVALFNLYWEQSFDQHKIVKCLQINLLLISVCILLPKVTGTDFSSYTYGETGTVGWFFAANEISAILSILFPYLYLLLDSKMSYKSLFLIVPTIFTMSMIGTKTSFLGMMIPALFFPIYFLCLIKKIGKRPFWISVIMLVMILCLSPNLPVAQNVRKHLENLKQHSIENTEHKKPEKPSEPDKVIDHTTEILLSSRDVFLKNTYQIYIDASMIDKVLGIGFHQREKIESEEIEKLIEMDFFDIFFRYGVIGTVLIFLPEVVLLFCSCKYLIFKKRKLAYHDFVYLYSGLIGCAISFLAGHVLGAPAVSIYIAIALVLFCMNHWEKKEV